MEAEVSYMHDHRQSPLGRVEMSMKEKVELAPLLENHTSTADRLESTKPQLLDIFPVLASRNSA